MYDIDMRLKYVFTVRRRREKEIMLQKQLEFEFEMYGDIVQGEFMDTYRNMTHKAIHSLRYALSPTITIGVLL